MDGIDEQFPCGARDADPSPRTPGLRAGHVAAGRGGAGRRAGPATRATDRMRILGLMCALSACALPTPLLAGGGLGFAGASGPDPAEHTGPAPDAQTAVALVTGSTDGLGREVALRMAETGAHVIIHGRNEERGAEVVAEIEAGGVGSARFYRADLASLDEVRALAQAILADYERLDVLVNNAGIWLQADDGRLLSEDGHELHFQVNYLSHFLLTRMLAPLIVDSAPARIVNVASGAQTPLDFTDLMLENDYSDGRGYAQSKLAQILFTMDLAEELADTEVVVTALHPATFMDTGMVLSRGADPRSSVEEGAEAVMNLILNPDVATGQYFNGLNPTRANDQAYDEAARTQLREVSLELVAPR